VRVLDPRWVCWGIKVAQQGSYSSLLLFSLLFLIYPWVQMGGGGSWTAPVSWAHLLMGTADEATTRQLYQ
jgi:hypothetical protein